MKASVICLVLVTILAIVSAEGHDIYDKGVRRDSDDAIRHFDVNNDRYMDLEEYMKATNTTVDYLPVQFDMDDDGKYNYEEFYDAYVDFLRYNPKK